MTNDELGVISFQLSAQVVGLADGVNKYMAEESGIFLADLEGFASPERTLRIKLSNISDSPERAPVY